jgi:hypothetical protein
VASDHLHILKTEKVKRKVKAVIFSCVFRLKFMD